MHTYFTIVPVCHLKLLYLLSDEFYDVSCELYSLAVNSLQTHSDMLNQEVGLTTFILQYFHYYSLLCLKQRITGLIWFWHTVCFCPSWCKYWTTDTDTQDITSRDHWTWEVSVSVKGIGTSCVYRHADSVNHFGAGMSTVRQKLFLCSYEIHPESFTLICKIPKERSNLLLF